MFGVSELMERAKHRLLICVELSRSWRTAERNRLNMPVWVTCGSRLQPVERMWIGFERHNPATVFGTFAKHRRVLPYIRTNIKYAIHIQIAEKPLQMTLFIQAVGAPFRNNHDA